MAIPKKGSRGIQVDGVGYRWRVRRHSHNQLDGGPLNLAVEHAEESGAVLIVALPQVDLYVYPEVPVTPADVEGHIREALAAGWKPTVPGKSFEM